MSVLLTFFFKFILIPFVQSQSTTAFCHMCHFVGAYELAYTDYTFSMSDFPKRCEIVSYGSYILDSEYTGNSSTFGMDEDAIRTLVAANIPVVMYLGYYNDETWYEIFDPKDQDLYDRRVCPLIQKINELKLTGITLGIADIYNGSICDYPTKISQFVTKLKTEIPNLIVGLHVSATASYDKITNDELFDFSITNSVIDYYVIKMYTRSYLCDDDIAISGTVITSSDPYVSSLDKFCNAVSQSSMAQDKTFAKVFVAAARQTPDGGEGVPYAEFCDNSGALDLCKWCVDNTTKLNAEGAYVKQTFHGISISWLDYDDFKGSCGCTKYIATNTLFDGFDGVAVTPCAKLDIR